MKKLLLICPTADRPEKLKRMLSSFRANSSECDIVFGLDAGDQKLPDILSVIEGYPREVTNLPLPNCVSKINDVWDKYKDKYEYFMMTADDIVYNQKGWDKLMIESIEDLKKKVGHPYCGVFCDDGIQGEKLCTHPLLTREFTECLGGYFPRNYMKHLYVDNAIMSIGKSLQILAYTPDVKIDHYHFVNQNPNKRAEIDESYKRSNSNARYLIDEELFSLWAKEAAPETVKGFKEKISKFKEGSK